MPYEDVYLIGIESDVNPNQSLKYEMLVMDLSLYAAGNPNCWVHSVKGGVADDNLLDETAYGFVNAY